MPSNIKTTITAETVDLEAKMAIARASTQATGAELRKLAKDATDAGTGVAKLSPELVQAAEAAAKSKAQVAELSAQLKAAKGSTDQFSLGMNLAQQAMGAFGAATSLAGVLALASSLEQSAVHIEHEAEVLGLTAAQYQVFAESAKLAGVEQDTADIAIRKFVDNLGKAQAGNKELQKDFDALGVSWQQSAATALPAVSYALLNMTDASEQARISVDMMGRSGQEIRPVLEQWAVGVDKLTDYLSKLGVLLDSDVPQGARASEKEFQKISAQLSAEFTPAVETAYGAVAKLANFMLGPGSFIGVEMGLGAEPKAPKPTAPPPQVEDVGVTGDTKRRDEDEAKDLQKFEENERKKTEAAKEEARKRAEAEKQANEQIAAYGKQVDDQLISIAKSHADTDLAISKMRIDEQKNILDAEVANGQITNAQKLAQLKDLVAQEADLDIQALEDERRQDDLTLAQREALNDQIRKAEEKKRVDLAAINREIADDARKTAEEGAKAWINANREVISAENTFISGMMSGRQTLGQAALSAAQTLVEKELESDAAYWTERALLAVEGVTREQAVEKGGVLMDLLFNQTKATQKVASEAAQTAATATGVATRNSTEAAGAAAGTAVQKIQSAGEIATNAGVAASGAMAAVAWIPLVGPALAAALGPATFAQAIGYEASVAAAGGEYMVSGDDVPYSLHNREAVMPAAIADPMRDFFSGGVARGGGDTHIHNWNLPQFDVNSVLADYGNRKLIEGHIKNAMRNAGRR